MVMNLFSFQWPFCGSTLCYQRWLILVATCLLFLGCNGGLTMEQIDGDVYRHIDLTEALAVLDSQHGDLVDVEVIGESYEGRSIYAVRVGSSQTGALERPEVLAIFAQHSSEHTMTNLAVDLIRELGNGYGADAEVTKLLDRANVWILPMVNPDGIEHDLSGERDPYTWRKNRRPTGADTFGVDLNRNWARFSAADEPIGPEHLDPSSENYWGSGAFSEPETRSLRDFIEAHPNLKLFLDYHTGSGSFMQGVIGCWMPKARISSATLEFCSSVIDEFAETISDPQSSLPAFQVVDEPEGILEVLHEYAPLILKLVLPDELPPIAGISTDYISGEKDIPGIGLEITRDQSSYFKNLPASQKEITERHMKGLLYLLEEVLEAK